MAEQNNELPEKKDDKQEKDKVKLGAPPDETGAGAYTEGSDIHIAPGQETHLPHEGSH